MDIHNIVTPEIITAYNNLIVAIMKKTNVVRVCFNHNHLLYNYAGIVEAGVLDDTIYFINEDGNYVWLETEHPQYWYWLDATYKELMNTLAQY